MDKYKQLDDLRERWKKASLDERKVIEQEAKLLKESMLYQCYYEDENGRCEKKQEDCWCSPEHKTAWQNENYKDYRQRGQRQLPISEIQKRLSAMKPTRQLTTSDL